IYCRKKETMSAPEEVMIDANELAKSYSFYNVGGLAVSPDNIILAYAEDTLSRRMYTIRTKNLETGEILPDQLAGTTGGAVWANDNKTVFYTTKAASLRPFKVFKHKLGSDAKSDKLIWHESDETFSTFAYKTKSKKYLVIGSYQTVSTEYRVLEADNPDGNFRIIQPRQRDLEYSISHYGDKFYIRTNLDAKNFRLMETPENATTKENWKEVIPHRSDVLLEDMEIFKDYLVLSERIKGIINIRIRPWDGSPEHYIDFGEDAYVAYTSVNPEFETDSLRLSYTSMTTPNSVLAYNMRDRSLKVLKEQEVVGDFDKNNYQSERIYATAR